MRFFKDSRLLLIRISVAIFCTFVGATISEAGKTAVSSIIESYQVQCQALQAEVLPEIDADLNVPPPKGILKVDAADIFEIEIDLKGNRATVVHADFGCTNFGHYWCGVSGSCTSYLIVDDVVFEWAAGGRPETVKGDNLLLLIKRISGFGCINSARDEGFGVSPCYKFAVWDEVHATFWSADGSMILREDLSPS